MTAHAMSGDREGCLNAGMDGYIAKPTRPAELFQTVSRFGKSHPTAFQSQTVGNAWWCNEPHSGDRMWPMA